jgi:hypothetical protein
MRRAVVVSLLLVALSPAAALAQSPFGPLPPAPQTAPQAQPTATPTVTAGDRGTSQGALLAIAGGVALVFLGIGWYITRDARAHLTDSDRRALDHERTEEERRRGKVVKSKARARGKRQRQARKAQRRR